LKPTLAQIKFLPASKAKSLNKTGDDGTLKERVLKNSIEFTQNPLTGLFLVRAKKIWDLFPRSMQIVWIGAVVFSSFIQWAACVALLLYFLGITVTDETSVSGEPTGVQMISTIVTATVLFIYLLGEIRSTFRAFQAAMLYLERDKWGYFISVFFLLDIFLHCAVAIMSVLGMATVNDISDKLQLALGFFFILEVDEWMYEVFINDFDVLDEEDFSIEDDSEQEEEHGPNSNEKEHEEKEKEKENNKGKKNDEKRCGKK